MTQPALVASPLPERRRVALLAVVVLVPLAPFYFGVERPEVEQRLLPTTWREGGAGIFGELAPGLTYRGYVVNGLNARGFSAAKRRAEGAFLARLR